ncbi:thiamine pyrophosphate-dependent enzyme [bacterium]|nr:thiamine pyrophosphate-dependent enzyme [bacterium]
MIDKALKKQLFTNMVRTRAMEERLIKMAKSSDGYFWIGGPGEEGFNVPLGTLVNKGYGIDYDYTHFHYRSSGCIIGMGAEPISLIRQMASVKTDPYSGGRHFVNHPAIKKWNVCPVNAPIETQYSFAIGTAKAQRNSKKGITIVTGGDAGTAEGDFATCLVWASRPEEELPMLIVVTNNRFGISTPYSEVNGTKSIVARAEAFNMKTDVINGNDPEESYTRLKAAMDYVRKERKPFCLEASVSRLHGHSSSSGANRVYDQEDCIENYKAKLLDEKVLTKKEVDSIIDAAHQECKDALDQVRKEEKPSSDSVYMHTFKEE